MCPCGKETNVIWIGVGERCWECFRKEYNVPLEKTFSREEKKRAQKITNNFINYGNKRKSLHGHGLAADSDIVAPSIHSLCNGINCMKLIILILLTILLLLMAFGSTDPTCTEEKRLKETPETHQRWVNLPDKSHCNLEV